MPGAVRRYPPAQLGPFRLDCVPQVGGRETGPVQQPGVPHHRAVLAHRPEAQLGTDRVPDLAHHQDVERDAQARSDRRRDLDPAAGQAEHDGIRRAAERRAEQPDEALPGGSAVREPGDLHGHYAPAGACRPASPEHPRSRFRR